MKTIPIKIDLREVFRISTGSSVAVESVIVKVESDGKIGWGNATANGVTNESIDSILKALKKMKSKTEDKQVDIEENWKDIQKDLPNDPSALAGFDIALYDLKGKLEGDSIVEIIGGTMEGIITDRTIGHMSKKETVEHAREFVDKGFKALKIKVGLGLTEDVKRVKAVREEVGANIDIWVDANQAFTPEESITLCKKLNDLNIEFVEQPVEVNNLEGLKKVTTETNIPIMADETVKGPEMAKKICAEKIADMINIKLVKSGGLTGGRKIAEIMEKNDVEGMVGCFGEPSISMAAGAHLYQSYPNLKYADLDGHFMLSENIASGLDFIDGKIWTSDKPGLGVNVDEEKINKCMIEVKGI